MPTSTSRLALTQPVGTDPASELRTSITGNASTLDGAVIVTEGTFASRPTSGSFYGQTYLATDVNGGTWYFWNGSAWETVMLAGAWTTLTLASGFSADPNSAYTPAARIEGDIVRLRGSVVSSGAISLDATITTLPSNMNPGKRLWLPAVSRAGASATFVSLFIDTTGVIEYYGSTSGSVNVYLDGTTFPLI